MTNWEKKILQIVRKVNPDDPLQYVHDIVRQDARKKLDLSILDCRKCPIHESTKALTYGPADASVLVISDYVFSEQDQRGGATYPFVGTEAYGLLLRTFEFYGIPWNDLFFVSTVNCCPFLKIENDILYRIPTLPEKESCKPILEQAVRIVQPKLMIILGNVALNGFIKANLDAVHGRVLDIMGIPAIATYSPEYLLRCKEKDMDMYECEKNIFFSDFEKIREEFQRIKEQL